MLTRRETAKQAASAARAAQEQLGDQSDELEQLKRQILLLGGLEHLQHLQQQQQHPPLTAGGYGGLSFGGPQQQQARLQHPSLALFGLPTGEGQPQQQQARLQHPSLALFGLPTGEGQQERLPQQQPQQQQQVQQQQARQQQAQRPRPPPMLAPYLQEQAALLHSVQQQEQTAGEAAAPPQRVCCNSDCESETIAPGTWRRFMGKHRCNPCHKYFRRLGVERPAGTAPNSDAAKAKASDTYAATRLLQLSGGSRGGDEDEDEEWQPDGGSDGGGEDEDEERQPAKRRRPAGRQRGRQPKRQRKPGVLLAPLMPPRTADGLDAAQVLARRQPGPLGALAAAGALVQLSHVPQKSHAFFTQMLAACLERGKFEMRLFQPDIAAADAGRGRQDWGHLPEKGPVMVHVDPGTNTPVLELPPRYKPVPGRKPLEVHAEPLVHEMLACPGGAAARLPPVRHLNGQPTAKTVKRDGGDRSELPRWSMQRNIWGKDVCLPLVWGVLAYGAAALQPKVSKAPLFITRLGGLKPNPSFPVRGGHRSATAPAVMNSLCSVQARPAFIGGQQLVVRQQTAARPAAAFAVSARYRGHGTDLAKVPEYARHSNDSGSPEVQIARMSARVQQLTTHLEQHKKDFSTRRGLLAILAQRKQMLLYLQRTNRAKYDSILGELNIRPLKNVAGQPS
ncbi:30S ribosomal S15 [Micractinium conductrix]|uniref:Small ribosomal subunit protein uS15c n=1 Tax=Micractinium conductrix TaxID=554055 RepID=A0A2P6VLM4_9CHLO|nr:30S ribosomal S15 [Micractinium conductrix]|eukprot:PSC74989.1 30S ribosomal S15 [Micractinium conductrix]